MKRGFTLVELSIVLVIIGLLIGGVLVARSMIETAKIQRLIRDLGQYEVATNNFITTYRQIPGDSPIFSLPGNGDGVFTQGPGGVASCNGDKYYEEAINFFPHLSQAGMIKGDYSIWSPAICGGPHPNNESLLGGVSMPFTELDALAASHIDWEQKNVITPFDLLVGAPTVGLHFVVNSQFTLPLEAKLGSAACDENNSALVGLCNYSGVAGNCMDTSIDTISCSDPTVMYGLFIYLIPPI